MSGRLPAWFKKRIPDPGVMNGMCGMLDGLGLHTVCQSALCPNIGDCFTRHTATFLILGNTCTRNCTFCAVDKGKPQPVDENEPRHILEAVNNLKLKHVVITSVTRDDLPDGGAGHFARIITILNNQPGPPTVEVLIPDFRGSREALNIVVSARPDILNHNVETVPRLYPSVRPTADFQRSVNLLRRAKQIDPCLITKSGLMVGLGETRDEIIEVMGTLRQADCDLLTIGQYLQPSARHHPVVRFLAPEEFTALAELGKSAGFREVASAPLVRSSFNAGEMYQRATSGKIGSKS
ncbi:MAG: lipoyl synthase [Dehalococcoidia bacterium]|nr:lipoyl synthase [Dehalococcoidia bacterium]